MRKGQVKLKKCLNCGKLMVPVKDPILKTYTGYLWHCDCMTKGTVISIGQNIYEKKWDLWYNTVSL